MSIENKTIYYILDSGEEPMEELYREECPQIIERKILVEVANPYFENKHLYIVDDGDYGVYLTSIPNARHFLTEEEAEKGLEEYCKNQENLYFEKYLTYKYKLNYLKDKKENS